MCRNTSWGKKCQGWDEWSCFPFSLYGNLPVQLRRFWRIGYYYLSKLNSKKPHWTSCHPTPFYWFHFASKFFLLFLAFDFFNFFSWFCFIFFSDFSISVSIILVNFIYFQSPIEEKYILFGFLAFCYFSRS